MAASSSPLVDFQAVPAKLDFPKSEMETLAYWQRIRAFETSVERNKDKPVFSFYDGPPFATGLPHYGHLLAGTIKDTVTRYAHMTGHHVERRFGWDCHGLPVEYEIDKTYGITSRQQVLDMGIPEYNARCRSIVMRYAKEWERIVSRMGRWIDFENDYKTLDTSFMESVWWVFGQLHAKGLVFSGFKVMPYSTACATPLSNFEAGQDYREVNDPAVVVSFPLVGDADGAALVAWTTTPWTLPSNLALCVHPEMLYVRVRDLERGAVFILLESRLEFLYPAKKAAKGKDAAPPKFERLGAPFAGATLRGLRYTPLFGYFAAESPAYFQVVTDTYVTADSGTGVVHQAPAFGDDDNRVCLAAGIIVKGGDLPCPIDANARFTDKVPEHVGVHVKAADEAICARLKAAGRLVSKGTIVHSYPFCWRSETPLIYRAIPSWFVNVPALRERLLANNKATHWVPAFVQEKRFHNWLEDAHDWAISRNRFWGTPLPIWVSDDGEETVIVSSVAELEALTGTTVTDLHREHIDHLLIPSRQGKGMLHRVDEVFDCWFESGSMPYAQKHYPFEHAAAFEASFPADFIAEGLDQTRGWFYTLLVISTALFDKPPFRNLIVNGLVLAADGKKMSKSKRNYPNPETEIINVYGADALRLYLINSPVVRAEPLRFQADGVLDVVKFVFNPWFNAYRFFVNYARRYQTSTGVAVDTAAAGESTNVMDLWVLSALQTLVRWVRDEMAAYRLYTVVPELVRFIDQLTNWWLRLNRLRLKGSAGQADARVALAVLFKVLYTLCAAMGPFTPFLVEMFYRNNLVKLLPADQQLASIHFVAYPEVETAAIRPDIEAAVRAMQNAISLARVIRDKATKPAKYPVRKMVVVHPDAALVAALEPLKQYIAEEANVIELELTSSFVGRVALRGVPLERSLGKRFRGDAPALCAAIRAMPQDACETFIREQRVTVAGHVLGAEDLEIAYAADTSLDGFKAVSESSIVVLMDLSHDPVLEATGIARDVLARAQKLRKTVGLDMEDRADVVFTHTGPADQAVAFEAALETNRAVFLERLGAELVPARKLGAPVVPIGAAETHTVLTHTFTLTVMPPSVGFDNAALLAAVGGEPARAAAVKRLTGTMAYAALAKLADGDALRFTLDGAPVVLTMGREIFRSLSATR